MRDVERQVMRYLVAAVLGLGLVTPGLVGVASADDGGRVRVTPYGNGQTAVCEVDGVMRDCYAPPPVTLYPPSVVGVPAGMGDEPVPRHEAGGREGN